MPEKIGSRLKHAWNAFMNRDPTIMEEFEPGSVTYSYRPDRPRFSRGNDRSITTSVYNRIAMDAAAVKVLHVRVDKNGRFKEEINDGLNKCLTFEANTDQTGRGLIQDIVMSMFDEGVVAVFPAETDINPMKSNSYEILQLRTAKITEWMPNRVKLRAYDERDGKYKDIIMRKDEVAIIENPFYAIMNEPNSTLQRLIRKLALLDNVDEQMSAGKLDMIIQLPFSVKSKARVELAEERRKDLEEQLKDSKYGIGYIDATEKITQLNRPLENNLLKTIEVLTNQLYNQLSITPEIMNGSADETAMTNYQSRCIEPILSAITDEFKRKFLTKTAISQGQSVMFFNDPFKLVPISKIAEIADTFTRNEIMSSNEIRQLVGMKPVDNPQADELRNKNINAADGQTFATTTGESTEDVPANANQPMTKEAGVRR